MSWKCIICGNSGDCEQQQLHIGELLIEKEDYKQALQYIHDWAALGGEHGEEPDYSIMVVTANVLDKYK